MKYRLVMPGHSMFTDRVIVTGSLERCSAFGKKMRRNYDGALWIETNESGSWTQLHRVQRESERIDALNAKIIQGKMS